MRAPIEGYFQAVRRLELADSADAAMRFLARDVRRALPRSFRNPNSNCVEFLPAIAGGRYCTSGDGCANPAISFGTAFSSFGVIGGLNYLPLSGDRIVFHNLGLDSMDAYQSPSLSTTNVALAGSGSTTQLINLQSAKTLPASLGQLDIGTGAGQLPQHFYVVSDAEQAVMYTCASAGTSNGEGTGRLIRSSRYGVNASAPASCPGSFTLGPNVVVLADKVSRCSLNSRAAGLTDRLDVLSIELEITRNGEAVRLYQEVQVYNDP
jgi:MSHA biogenesis protein MshO